MSSTYSLVLTYQPKRGHPVYILHRQIYKNDFEDNFYISVSIFSLWEMNTKSRFIYRSKKVFCVCFFFNGEKTQTEPWPGVDLLFNRKNKNVVRRKIHAIFRFVKTDGMENGENVDENSWTLFKTTRWKLNLFFFFTQNFTPIKTFDHSTLQRRKYYFIYLLK